ncbi:MAG: hypothetical protein R2863_03985 [Candidatus Kapaibacterium sp.]|nr:hypothetical protein [Ignavibacteriota bacterium]MCB9221027.1 hypothetical protein [Ignavibacteria bacterium]
MKQTKLQLFTTLIITFLFVSCSESIVSECETDIKVDNQMRASFKDIQEKVFTPSCATSGCHGGSFFSYPNLEKENAYTNIVGKNNSTGTMKLIEQGNSTSSYLYKRLLGEGGSLMPRGGPKLNQSILDSIKVWIDNGAENN